MYNAFFMLVIKMIFNQFQFILICLPFLTINKANCYLLVTTNLEDFKSIAKKIVPNQLADQLADMASHKDGKEEASEYEQDSTDTTDAPTRYAIKNNIDLDELVERVKKKLEQEYESNAMYVKNEEDSVSTDEYYYKDETSNKKTTYDSEVTRYPKIRKRISKVTLNARESDMENMQYDSQKKWKYYKRDKDIYSQNRSNIIEYVTEKEQDYDGGQENNSSENEEYQEYAEYNGNEGQVLKIIEYNSDSEPNEEEKSIPEPHNQDKPIRERNHSEYVKFGGNYKEMKGYDKDVKTTSYYEQYPAHSKRYKKISNIEQKHVDTNDKATSYDTVKINYPNEKAKIEISTDVKETPVYYEDEKDTEIFEETDLLKEVDLLKVNDSYEDYVTPKRENIFESEETTKTKMPLETNNNPKIVFQKAKFTENVYPKVTTEKTNRGKIIKSEEVKAKTETLWYDDEIQFETKNEDHFSVSTKRLKGTMMPTLKHFKMSSPDYLSKIKAVAEKYDFSEPLPEKDRQREIIKEIANPPASINKKVLLH